MEYKKIRSKIKSGDILAWSGKSIFSKIIKFWTKSNFTHVGVAWKANNRIFVIESMDFIGVRIFPLSRLRPFHWISRNQKIKKSSENFLFRHVGDKYSFLGCLKAVLKADLRRDRRWQCAEFVLAFLEYEKENIEGVFSVPKDIVKFLENKCQKKALLVN